MALGHRLEGVYGAAWLRKHWGKLVEFGVPAAVANESRRWTYVLEHGHDPESGWVTDWLSDEQAAGLLSLIEESIHGELSGASLVDALRRRRSR